MPTKYVEVKHLQSFLAKNPTPSQEEIDVFVRSSTIEIYLGWDKRSIAEVLMDNDRGDEYEDLSDEKQTEILELFAGWVVDNNFSDLDLSLIEAIDCIG